MPLFPCFADLRPHFTSVELFTTGAVPIPRDPVRTFVYMTGQMYELTDAFDLRLVAQQII
jgi:hypothetical protein